MGKRGEKYDRLGGREERFSQWEEIAIWKTWTALRDLEGEHQTKKGGDDDVVMLSCVSEGGCCVCGSFSRGGAKGEKFGRGPRQINFTDYVRQFRAEHGKNHDIHRYI